VDLPAEPSFAADSANPLKRDRPTTSDELIVLPPEEDHAPAPGAVHSPLEAI
jgi:hypothetical protein